MPGTSKPAAACPEQTEPGTEPASGAFSTIDLRGIAQLAVHFGITQSKAMVLSLEREVWPLRFARNRGVFSADQQRKLLQAKAAVIGCGGLGGHVASLLARVGVGALILCDGDVFSESNLNRQLFCRESNLGQNKAESAAGEIRAIASHAALSVYPFHLTGENASSVLGGADIVLDCLDNIPARFLLAKAAGELGIPMIYAAVAGNEGFTAIVPPGAGTLEKIYGPAAAEGAEKRLGVPTLTPAATAALQAALAIKVLTGGAEQAASLYHLDLLVPLLESLDL